ncbi:unnamed protein product [Effrenium voratum]|nr:unnamed protein product [Effrenium voratum]
MRPVHMSHLMSVTGMDDTSRRFRLSHRCKLETHISGIRKVHVPWVNQKTRRDTAVCFWHFGCCISLRGIAYRWASGESLSEIMKDSQFQEGAIVRAIVRAEELLRKLQDVAKLLGNRGLHDVFSEAADLIHRDIAFVPSLYIKRT